jgi:hypothetical protein
MLKRAATYIQVRRDAKTRRGKLKCKPPNRRCGGRCIPPTWDCRLNNEGNDPHLTAAGKGVDVTAGVADLQRGVKKLKKGVVTLSPDEIESGRRSISRGVKKLAPGDLQRKQEVQKKVYKAIGMVGAPLTVGILAFAMHRALKGVDSQTGGNFPYRRAMGDRIDNAAVSAVSSLRRNMPLGFGDRFIANDMLAKRNIRNTGYGVGQVAGVPDVPLSRTANTGYLGRQTSPDVQETIMQAQRASVNFNGQDRTNLPFDEWQRRSRDIFWRTPRGTTHAVPNTDNASGSVFSPKAANNLLRDSFRLNVASDLKPRAEQDAVIKGVQDQLDQTARTVRAAMSQATLNSRDPNDVELYIGRNPLSLTGNADVDRRSRALIVDLVTSRDPQAAKQHANSLYRETVNGFDQYFGAVAERASTPPGPNRAAQAQSFYVDANRAHAEFLGRSAGVNQRVTGPGTQSVTNRIVHAKQALGLRKPKITLTDSEIVNALSELGRSTPPTREGQLASLNEAYKSSQASFLRVPPETRSYGNAPPTPGPQGPAPKGGPPAPAPKERSARRRLRTAAQIAADLQKAGWGVEAAQAEAAKIVRSRKTDSVDREDKKCGKSGIPEGRKCTKKTLAATGTSGPSAEGAQARTKGYNFRRAASFAARAAFTVGSAAAAVDYVKNKKGRDLRTVFGFAMLAMLGAKSLASDIKNSKSSEKIVADLNKLKESPEVDKAALSKFQKFVTEADISSERVPTLINTMGVAGFFNPADPDRIRISEGATNKMAVGGTVSESATQGVAKFLEARAKYGSKFDPDAPINLDMMEREWTAALYIKNSEARQAFFTLHEGGHALHARNDYKSPREITVAGKKYAGSELTEALRKTSSLYGQHDLERKAKLDDYYSTGSRLEVFAEHYPIYIMQGKALKKANPVAYEWTKQTAEDALSKPYKIKAVTPEKWLEQLKLEAETRKADRADADKTAEELWKDMQKAFKNGDVRLATETLVEAKGQDPMFKQMLGSIYETICLYAALDSVENVKTDSVDREDKKCGKSGIAPGKKCTKQTTAGAVEPAKPSTTASPEPVAKPNNRAKILKIAAISAAVALSVGTTSLAKKYSPELLRTGIEGLSSGAVNSAIKSLPTSLQAKASKLQGDAKLSLAVMSMKADKMEMVGVNEQSNFSTWKSPKGGLVSVGSVGDSLVAFYSDPSRGGSSRVPGYNVSFKVDQHYKQKEGVDRKQGVKMAKTIESMFNEHVAKLPDNALLTATAFNEDGKGAKRASIYTRKGFTDIYTAKDGLTVIGIFKAKGKLVKPPEDEKERQAMWQKIHEEA